MLLIMVKVERRCFRWRKSMNVSITFPGLKHTKAKRALIDEEFENFGLAALAAGCSSRTRPAVDYKALVLVIQL
jgi:hypothetical protein